MSGLSSKEPGDRSQEATVVELLPSATYRVKLGNEEIVTAHAAGGIGTVRAAGLHKNDGEYTNDVYGKTAHKITVDVQGGIGEIELVQEP